MGFEPTTAARDAAAGTGGAADAWAVPATRSTRRARRRRPVAAAWLVIIVVTLLAAGLRFYHLGAPHSYVFDEVYYAKDGCYDAGYPWRQCKLAEPGNQTVTVHPPLGRWIIAGGERAFGNDAFGWRFASAVAGTLSVLLVSIMAFRLFGRAVWAGAAGLLLATENLNFVQSRIATLDIFVTLFVVAGYLFLVLDRLWIDRRTPAPGRAEEADFGLPPDRPPAPVMRPWRLLAGLAFGAALATKWSGGPALAGAVCLTIVWEYLRRRRLRLPSPLAATVRDESLGILLFLIIVPLACYVASYGQWFAGNGLDLTSWWDLQKGMAIFSMDLHAHHPYASAPWKWALMWRPVAYYYECAKQAGAACRPTEILGMGNPAIFWGAVIALPYTLVAGWRRRDWRAALIVFAFSFQYFPWYGTTRTSFFYYMAPITPFMVLACVYGLRDLSAGRLGEGGRTLAPLAVAAVVVSVATFAFFWPILVAQPISYSAWHLRMWFPSWV